MDRLLLVLFVVGVIAAAGAEEELIDVSDIYMGIVEGECTAVNSANVITIKDLGEVALIGVLEASPGDDYYYEAVNLLKTRLLDREVQIEVCSNLPMNEKGQIRAKSSEDFKFASSVAAFGMILRCSQHNGNATLEMVEEVAGEGVGTDSKGYRAEFVELVRKAGELGG